MDDGLKIGDKVICYQHDKDGFITRKPFEGKVTALTDSYVKIGGIFGEWWLRHGEYVRIEKISK